MKKYIKTLFATTILLLAFIMTGCTRVEEKYTIHSNATVDVDASIALSKEVMDAFSGSSTTPDGYHIETINGKQYYVTSEKESNSLSHYNQENTSLQMTTDIFVISNMSGMMDDEASQYNSSDSSLDSIFEYCCFQVTLPSPIVETNGTRVDDYTVKWEYSPSTAASLPPTCYAYTATGKAIVDADATAPTLTGVKEHTYYNSFNTSNSNKKGCFIPTNAKADDDSGIVFLTLNGKNLSDITEKDMIQGENTITATDIKGNTTSITFYYDSQAPVIKGLKKNRTYKKGTTFYVKDTVELKKVTINGKRITLKKQKSGKNKGFSKYKIAKSGRKKIVAYDKAGNKTSLTVYIK